MAKWANSAVLDNGPETVRTRAGAGAVKEYLLNNYSAGDSYATVTAAANVIAKSANLDNTTDLTVGASGSNRVLTVAAKSGITAIQNTSTPDLHLALIDETNSLVLLVTDETSNQGVASGNTVNLPSWTYTVNQPT